MGLRVGIEILLREAGSSVGLGERATALPLNPP